MKAWRDQWIDRRAHRLFETDPEFRQRVEEIAVPIAENTMKLAIMALFEKYGLAGVFALTTGGLGVKVIKNRRKGRGKTA